MFSLFGTKNSVEPHVVDWIFDTFNWALLNFDAKIFFNETPLVLPNNEFFPGKMSSEQEMAQGIFDRTKKYAHVENWPFRLVAAEHFPATALPLLPLTDAKRQLVETTTSYLPLSYQPSQLSNPQTLIADYAYGMAFYLASHINSDAPGGKEVWPQTIEILACFLGFGVMLSNTAYSYKGGCGSCHTRTAKRQAALPEDEQIVALAIFCQLKQIPNKNVLPHLKKYLRSIYKSAVKDITNRPQDMRKLEDLCLASAEV